MNQVTPELIQDIVDRLVRASNPRQIILFGSQVRGNAGAESDLDVLVVEDAPFGQHRSRREEWWRLYSSLRGCRVPVDVLVYSVDEVEKWRTAINHVVHDAVTEGEVVYERP